MKQTSFSLSTLTGLMLVLFTSGLSLLLPAYASDGPHRVQLKPIARNYMESGDYQKALLLLQRWHEATPEDMEALFYLSQAMFETGDIEGSHQALEKLRLLAPNSPWTKAASLWKLEHPHLAMNPAHLKQNMALVSVALNPVTSRSNSVNAMEAPGRFIPAQEQAPLTTSYAPEPPVANPALIRYTPEPYAPVVQPPANNLPEPLPLFKEATLGRGDVQGLQAPAIPTPPAIYIQRLEPQAKPAINTRTQPPTTPYTRVMEGSDTQKPQVAGANGVSTVPTQEELARNMQTLQQMMMMQMMSSSMAGGAGNAGMNPYAAMMGGGNGASPNGLLNNMPMMMQMMQAQQGGAMGAMPGGINPAMYSQMMQSTMLNSMNDMFSSSSKNDNDDGGFGF